MAGIKRHSGCAWVCHHQPIVCCQHFLQAPQQHPCPNICTFEHLCVCVCVCACVCVHGPKAHNHRLTLNPPVLLCSSNQHLPPPPSFLQNNQKMYPAGAAVQSVSPHERLSITGQTALALDSNEHTAPAAKHQDAAAATQGQAGEVGEVGEAGARPETRPFALTVACCCAEEEHATLGQAALQAWLQVVDQGHTSSTRKFLLSEHLLHLSNT